MLNGKLPHRTRLHEAQHVLSPHWHAVNYHDMCYFRPSTCKTCKYHAGVIHVNFLEAMELSRFVKVQFKEACIPDEIACEACKLDLNATPGIVLRRLDHDQN